jgi:hypothetical protein
MKIKELGKFDVITGTVVLSDPCYEINGGCQQVIENILPGTWECKILGWDGRVAELMARHSTNVGRNAKWTEGPGKIGVDSGQAGIFDEAHYRDDAVEDGVARIGPDVICPEEPWYSLCCDRSLNSKSGAGVIPFGVVSSSGYGDGEYSCYIQRDKKVQVIGIKIVFITAEDRQHDGQEGH